jgi:hypothetical protein
MDPNRSTLYLFIRILLWAVAGVTFAVGLLWWWMFWVFYLRFVTVFENGRYFDPVEEVVYTDSGMVHGIIAALLWAISAAAVLVLQGIKSRSGR